MRKLLVPVFALCCLASVSMAGSAAFQELSGFHVREGVLYHGDGREVALFGTNYLPMSWRNMST